MSDTAALEFQLRVLSSENDKLHAENQFLRDEIVQLLRERRSAKYYANRLKNRLTQIGATDIPEE